MHFFFETFLLAILSASVLVVPVSALAKNLMFNVTVVCDVPGIDEWCASAYYYDHDTFTSNDPLYWFQGCTREKQLKVGHSCGNPGGDGIFQSHYEIGWTVYHSCTATNAKLKNNRPEDCECTPSTYYIAASYAKHELQIVDHLVYWPYLSYNKSDPKCKRPDAFDGINSTNLPNKTCAWDVKEERKYVFAWKLGL